MDAKTWAALSEEERARVAEAAAKRRALMDEVRRDPTAAAPDVVTIQVGAPLNHRIKQGGGIRVRLDAE